MSTFRTSLSVFEVFLSSVSSLLLAELSLQRVPGAQGDEEGLGEAQEHQEDTLGAEDKVAGH